jgi:hypothetical protein
MPAISTNRKAIEAAFVILVPPPPAIGQYNAACH